MHTWNSTCSMLMCVCMGFASSKCGEKKRQPKNDPRFRFCIHIQNKNCSLALCVVAVFFYSSFCRMILFAWHSLSVHRSKWTCPVRVRLNIRLSRYASVPYVVAIQWCLHTNHLCACRFLGLVVTKSHKIDTESDSNQIQITEKRPTNLICILLIRTKLFVQCEKLRPLFNYVCDVADQLIAQAMSYYCNFFTDDFH